MNFFLVIVISFIIGLVLAAIISKYGFKLGLADIPNQRSAHHIPIPKGGGIGIPIAVIIVCLFINEVYILIGLAFVSSVIALINDRKGIPVSLRLILEFTLSIAIVLVYKIKGLIYIYNNYSLLVVIALALFFSISWMVLMVSLVLKL
jgi:UDP-N-acetylmuramyl pentapeptide phosphotransferase/UDP-N-acetylglucosamine-1-phosphate transferase